MADVLIVCVREDEPQAKALAEMFEAAGFSVGGAPSTDAALRSSGAGLIVWSQASIRSRPFLDAAQRVINANKAVVASLIEPPPPSSIGDSQAFDLSEWSGDPNDPSLDPLFFAIDRMVNSARAEVQAAPARQAPQAYVPPPRAAPPPAPSYSRRPPPPATPQPSYTRTPPAPDRDLGSEAEHWRAIRDSRDPADFMDYLARYGAEGAFADVAELRLNQLTAQPEARAPQQPAPRPPPPPMRTEPPPQRRAEAPPRRQEPRLDPPPQRRADPPPPRRREPTYERSYERAGDHREPPSTGGGAMRAFILIAILGGLALAGGLYFGGGLGDLGGSRTAETTTENIPPTAPLGEDPATADNSDGGVAVSDAADTTPPTAQERRQAEQQRQREEQQRRQQQQAEDGPTPAPTTSWTTPQQASNTGGGGPVSLRPGDGGTNSGSSAVVPIPPSVTQPDTQTVSTTTTVSTPPLRTAATGNVLWASRPSASRIGDLYPARALRDNVGGRVELDCTVQATLALTCTVARETPAALGFGRAALSAAGSYRARPELSNGASAVGARTRIAIQFQAPGE